MNRLLIITAALLKLSQLLQIMDPASHAKIYKVKMELDYLIPLLIFVFVINLIYSIILLYLACALIQILILTKMASVFLVPTSIIQHVLPIPLSKHATVTPLMFGIQP